MATPLHQVYVPETHVLLFVLKETRCRESERPLPIQAPWRTAALLCPVPEEGWLRLPWEMVGEGRDMAVMPHFSWVHPPPHSRGAEVNLWDLLTCGAQCHLGSLSENRGQRMSTV